MTTPVTPSKTYMVRFSISRFSVTLSQNLVTNDRLSSQSVSLLPVEQFFFSALSDVASGLWGLTFVMFGFVCASVLSIGCCCCSFSELESTGLFPLLSWLPCPESGFVSVADETIRTNINKITMKQKARLKICSILGSLKAHLGFKYKDAVKRVA